MFNQFNQTRKLFANCISLDENTPLTYDQWMKYPDDYKSAILFLQYYDQITLAWSKFAYTGYASPEDAVECVLQYLEKNVTKIKEDAKRFKPSYIYKICYNCLYCECLERPVHVNKHNYEISENHKLPNGDTVSLYDLYERYSNSTSIDDALMQSMSDQFWNELENLDIQSQAIIERWLGGQYKELWQSFIDAGYTDKKRPPAITEASLRKAISDFRDILTKHAFPIDDFSELVIG